MYPTTEGSISLIAHLRTPYKVSKLMTSFSNGFSIVVNVNNHHSFAYNLDFRRNENYSTTNFYLAKKDASDSEKPTESQMWTEVQPQSIKSSISHTYNYSTLDNPSYPSKGFKFGITNTLSGLFGYGDVNLASTLMKYTVYVPVVKNQLTASLGTKIGFAVPLGKYGAISLNDRFTSSVRGYQTLGKFNPATEEEYGGNVLATGVARIITPVPIDFLRKALGMQFHAFFNAGNVVKYDFKQDYSNTLWNTFMNGLQSSYGAGVAMNLPIGRMEFNWCRPYLFKGQKLEHSFKNWEWKFVVD